MAVAQRMTMRTTIQRLSSGDKDDYGKSIKDYRDYHLDIPCYAWEKSVNVAYNDTSITGINIIKMILSKAYDIKRLDRISYVKDRLGNEIYGQMEILNIIPKKNYQQLELKKISC